MFKELAALAQHSPLLLLVSREGEKLRVNLTRKADEDEKTTALSLSILATAEELDAELPLALAEGLAMSDAPAATPTVTDQVKSQVAATSSGDDGVVEPVVKKMRATKAKRVRRFRVKKAPPKPVATAPKKRARKGAAASTVITPLIKPEPSPTPAAPRRRRRKGAATNTPEGGTSAGSGEPTAMRSAPAPESGTGAGATAAGPVGEAQPPAETKPPASETNAAPGETKQPASGTDAADSGTHAVPATARETKTLDLFS